MPSAYRGVIGARFGCLQMGMGEFGVRSRRGCAGGGPARGRASRRPVWSEPVKSVINRLWTTLVDKWSPSVPQVSCGGRQLNIDPAASPSATSGKIARACEFSTGESYETALAWTSGPRDGRRSGLPVCLIRRHARCHDAEMTFERAELIRWGGSDDGGWHGGWGWRDRWVSRIRRGWHDRWGSGCAQSVERRGFGHRGHRMARRANRFRGSPVKRSGERPHFGRCRAWQIGNLPVTRSVSTRQGTYRSTSDVVGLRRVTGRARAAEGMP